MPVLQNEFEHYSVLRIYPNGILKRAEARWKAKWSLGLGREIGTDQIKLIQSFSFIVGL